MLYYLWIFTTKDDVGVIIKYVLWLYFRKRSTNCDSLEARSARPLLWKAATIASYSCHVRFKSNVQNWFVTNNSPIKFDSLCKHVRITHISACKSIPAWTPSVSCIFIIKCPPTRKKIDHSRVKAFIAGSLANSSTISNINRNKI